MGQLQDSRWSMRVINTIHLRLSHLIAIANVGPRMRRDQHNNNIDLIALPLPTVSSDHHVTVTGTGKCVTSLFSAKCVPMPQIISSITSKIITGPVHNSDEIDIKAI